MGVGLVVGSGTNCAAAFGAVGSDFTGPLFSCFSSVDADDAVEFSEEVVGVEAAEGRKH